MGRESEDREKIGRVLLQTVCVKRVGGEKRREGWRNKKVKGRI